MLAGRGASRHARRRPTMRDDRRGGAASGAPEPLPPPPGLSPTITPADPAAPGAPLHARGRLGRAVTAGPRAPPPSTTPSHKADAGRAPERSSRGAIPRPCSAAAARGGPAPHRRTGTLRRMGRMGSGLGGPGRGRVQICHKGVSRRDRPRAEARNINDSLSALRRDGGLCNRFGQTAPPRVPGRSAADRAALSWSASARSRPARRGMRRHHRINSPGRRTTRTTTPTPHRNTPGVPARKAHHAPWERTITTSLPRKSEQTPAE